MARKPKRTRRPAAPRRRQPIAALGRTARLPAQQRLDAHRCEQFLLQEARLLDDGKFDDWLALFTPDAWYWVPSEPDQADPVETVSLIYDDRRLLDDRKLRFIHAAITKENYREVLTPLLNSAVYYLVFGILFQANRGISHYIAYLVTGVFIFGFTERSIVVGSTVMRANIALIRALHFPRACLPLAYVMVEFQQLLLSMLVLFTIVLSTGEPLTWYWLLLAPVMVLQATFNMGAALIMARLGAGAQDVSQLVPFLTRIWRYFCGVMYSIASLPASLPEWAKGVLSLNPGASIDAACFSK